MSPAFPPLTTEQLETVARTIVGGRVHLEGELRWPCVPSMAEVYTEQLVALYALAGRQPSTREVAELRQAVVKQLAAGYAAGPGNFLHVVYKTPEARGKDQPVLVVKMGSKRATLDQIYGAWKWNREDGAEFGKHPDALLMDEVKAMAADGRRLKVLDVGAGTGRNAFAMAKLGHETFAIELTREYVDAMCKRAAEEKLPVLVRQGNLHEANCPLPPEPVDVIIASEVVTHFANGGQLAAFTKRMAGCLRPGGRLILNLFQTRDALRIGQTAREVSYLLWSTTFDFEDIAAAMAAAGLRLVRREQALAFEKANLPAEAWPPTPWYERWASGTNAFPMVHREPPIELVWLVATQAEGA